MEQRAKRQKFLAEMILAGWLFGAVRAATVQTSDLSIGGVGSGVVAIIAFLILGVMICIFGRCTAVPYLFAIIGTILPVLVAIIIYFLPKQSERPKQVGGDNEPTSWIPVLRWTFAAFTYLMAIVALLCLFLLFCTKPFEAYRVGTDSSSLVTHSGRGEHKMAQNLARDKYVEKPQIDTFQAKERARFPGSNLGPVEEEDQHRRRKDLVEPGKRDGDLLAPEGPARDTGKNQVRPGRLPPVDRQRQFDMGIEIHTPPRRRRLNMVDPEQRSVRVDHINVEEGRHMLDSDDDN